jgi:hypothetical protein
MQPGGFVTQTSEKQGNEIAIVFPTTFSASIAREVTR